MVILTDNAGRRHLAYLPLGRFCQATWERNGQRCWCQCRAVRMPLHYPSLLEIGNRHYCHNDGTVSGFALCYRHGVKILQRKRLDGDDARRNLEIAEEVDEDMAALVPKRQLTKRERRTVRRDNRRKQLRYR